MSETIQSKPLPSFIEERLDFYIQDLIEPNENKKHLVLGKRPPCNAVVLQSNDYLALSHNKEIQSAHRDAISQHDDNVVMSAIFLQDDESKPVFETQLASFVGMPSCLLSQSGWAANLGLLQTICAPNIPVYIDFFAHMSLWEGARIAGAQIHPFMHNNTSHLRKQISRHGSGIIVVDSVYSTIGTIAPLRDIYEIAQEFDCGLVVDESHSLGTHGPQGAGILQGLGLTHKVDFITVSLAKTFAYRAGAILGPEKLAKTLPFVAYPAIFSSTVLPQEIIRLEKTLDVIRKSDDKRDILFERAKSLAVGLKRIGFTIRSESQIISLECGNERNTERVRDFLEERNVYGAVFCRPATGRNKNIIRFSVNADMTAAEVDHVLTVCQQAFAHPDLEFV
ncbi:alpha-hydroxyketone-type quorum-sensing autoinducer synthase [Vibrio sp. Vb5032]|uniref:alpha-hydroxyketone-type quorum-sensing autoinducer synthase n=1 Tax=unclassified Vibrio TaxID=2614977 RepID=UPI001A1C72CA|nr:MULTISPECIES: alpha-hydroxyketone-type quorum-sensing autoinducer synthase [unclassified Vibrio]EGQ7762765.1 quorum-sensing autoinducer synthase [Vibrio alginolyticus]MCF7509488.1 quorum-sensing autoinducer CAI-1 synthase [Vibrio sp. D54]MDW1520521.1 alpha-hydroxyketone-type quorum-sensing autoinducer synthase [Vibrio sp. Vb5032]MDW1819426.1 alpha-hydroxyketone-type quorum-sensing autoinducer synthase [Vibrio sp. Vb1018]MDW2002314.1 alpha-hydroxyketone-type quorum-sensing autoinducer syntha